MGSHSLRVCSSDSKQVGGLDRIEGVQYSSVLVAPLVSTKICCRWHSGEESTLTALVDAEGRQLGLPGQNAAFPGSVDDVPADQFPGQVVGKRSSCDIQEIATC